MGNKTGIVEWFKIMQGLHFTWGSLEVFEQKNDMTRSVRKKCTDGLGGKKVELIGCYCISPEGLFSGTRGECMWEAMLLK